MKKITQIVKKTFSIGYGILYLRPKELTRFLCHPSKWCCHKSYYPEKEAKSKTRVFIDQLYQILRFGTPNVFYFSYGFDVKTSREMKSYYHVIPFMSLRDKYNLRKYNSSTIILQNKFYFGMFCDYLGINTGTNIGILDNGKIFLPSRKETIDLRSFCNEYCGDFFVKLVDGKCGCDIFTLSIYKKKIIINGNKGNIDDVKGLCNHGIYIIQKRVEQHPLMASLHQQSLNTMRLVTVKNIHTGEIKVLPSILRIGTGKSFVDNTSQGGIAVGVNLDNGNLKTYGFYKPEFGGRVTRHPDSGIKFDEFTIPFFKEAVTQALFLHSKLPDIHSIGWDIAIGSEGPIFIEGNDNWEINGPQICNGGLKNLFTKYLLNNE